MKSLKVFHKKHLSALLNSPDKLLSGRFTLHPYHTIPKCQLTAFCIFFSPGTGFLEFHSLFPLEIALASKNHYTKRNFEKSTIRRISAKVIFYVGIWAKYCLNIRWIFYNRNIVFSGPLLCN